MVGDNWYLLISVGGKVAISPRPEVLVQPTRHCFSRRTQATMLRQSLWVVIWMLQIYSSNSQDIERLDKLTWLTLAYKRMHVE